MSKGYKVYHRYLATKNSTPSTSVTFSETTGSGDFNSINPITPNYTIAEKTNEEVEAVFKEKYPLQYLLLRKKFHKKLKKLYKANEQAEGLPD